MKDTKSRKLAGRVTYARYYPPAPTAWSAAWACTTWTPAPYVHRDSMAPYGSVGITADALFDLFSTARSAPANTYYADAAKADDTGNGLTAGTAKKSIHACVTLGNASGAPFKVIVAAGSYPRANNISNGNSVFPTQDCFFVASAGRVVTGTWDDFANLTADATYTNTYSVATSNINRVVDRLASDRYGNMLDLMNVSSPAICNRTPNSWHYDGTKLYINRADGVLVTNANTRYYRSSTGNAKITANINIGFSVADASSMWAFEGGNTSACLNYSAPSLASSFKIVLANKCTFQYAGGVNDTGAAGVKIDNLHGVAAFFECEADANYSDGFNIHRSSVTGAKSHMVTVNCTAYDNGRAPSTSNNGWTSHEDCVGLDVAGIYRNNRGGTFRSINTTLSWFVNPIVRDDQGDLTQGGAQWPAAWVANDTAKYWIDSPVYDMPATGMVYNASATATIYYRNAPPPRSTLTGAGTVTTY